MRAVFSIDLHEADEGTFPADEALLQLFRGFGWEFREMEKLTSADIRNIMRAQTSHDQSAPVNVPSEDPAHLPNHPMTPQDAVGNSVVAGSNIGRTTEAALAQYKRLAKDLFEEMPEVAGAEQAAVLFTGYIADDQTLFVMTRMVPGQLTFRLLHRELPRLQTSTEKMMRKVTSARLKDKPLHIGNPTVILYERKFDHVIITGRVITRVWHETIKSNLKDALLTVVPLGLFLPTTLVLLSTPILPTAPISFWRGTLERLDTAFLTTALVSALGLLQTWIEIRRGRLIDWSVPKDRRTQK